jgi:23S rRNA pseudouridine2605 synthase
MRAARFHLVLHEGWNRQVRRMCLEVGMKVLRLSRVRYAFLTLEGVERGTLRSLTPGEIARLRKMVDL